MPPAPNHYSQTHAEQSRSDSSQGSEPESDSGEGGQPARVFVEHYPNDRAGAPIDSGPLDDFDLAAYIGSCGPFADPKVFRAAELLVSSNLTNAQRTEFLESEVVSNIQGFDAGHLAFFAVPRTSSLA